MVFEGVGDGGKRGPTLWVCLSSGHVTHGTQVGRFPESKGTHRVTHSSLYQLRIFKETKTEGLNSTYNCHHFIKDSAFRYLPQSHTKTAVPGGAMPCAWRPPGPPLPGLTVAQSFMKQVLLEHMPRASRSSRSW